MLLPLLVIAVATYVTYEVVKGRGRASLVVLAVVNSAAAVWNVLS